ncbi:hypothetical protein GO755_26885 [Spirosoma sp. HMF4905]|uniref:Putative beta-lactamase-inhibitor-like PepSY-like domain-containing protein n=1 Tax=Spirosoma arboris TaxID=2682092 RepID=A0A7K1SIY7_9BACT|nr:PepSY-like domain-containing protein [Spirosoma arboris]MVM33694.1 hypothetical protein [Spirosoma arboris]
MRYTIAFLLVIGVAGSLQAQLISEKQVPVTIQQALKKLHPTVQNLQWERSTPYYEAIFTLNNNHRAIKFDTKGQVAETEVGIPIATLPASIAAYMKAHYPKERIQAAETVTKANSEKTYEIRITGMEVVFSSTGKFLEEEKD